jgi:hypothetical protein
MIQSKIKLPWLLFFIVTFSFVLNGCMITKPKVGETFSCAKESSINKIISPEAQLEDFSCIIKQWDGSDTLHFNIAVKNISKEDQRFKVNIFLANGKAVGGLLPRKIKKGLLKPGETLKFTYPVKGVDYVSGTIDLLVKTMAK